MFEIESGIPAPKHKLKQLSNRSVFLERLNVDDSFVCSRREYRILFSYAKRKGMKLMSQRVEYDLGSGHVNHYEGDLVRVWRIE